MNFKQIDLILHQLQSNFTHLKKAAIKCKKEASHKQISKQDKKKLLKLFGYSNWKQFMGWVEEKLEQGGQQVLQFQDDYLDQQSFKLQLTEEQSQNLNNTKKKLEQEQSEIMALQNGKLRRQNIILKNKLIELRASMREQQDD